MKNKVKDFIFIIAFPLVTFLIMDTIVNVSKGHHMIRSMLDVVNIIRTGGISAILAFALSFNLSSGRFDLSLGAQRLAGTIIGGTIALNLGLSGIWLMLFAIIFGAIFGLLTGIIFVTLRVPPMVLGIGMGLIWEVFPYVFTSGKGLILFGKPGVQILSNTYFIVGTVVIVGVIMTLLMNKTKFGYELRAIQGSQVVAQNSGIDIFKHTVLCYTFAGALVCVAGVISTAYATNLSSSLGLASSGAVAANMFPMILGGYLGRRSNDSIGTIVAAITIRIFAYGLAQMEFSEANASVFSQLVFVGFLIFLANEFVFKAKKAEKARIAEAIEYKKEAGIA